MSVNIMDVAQMIQDQEAVQKDMEEATRLVHQLFHEKYMSKMEKAVEAHQRKTAENPSKEVRLIQAMKHFVPEENRERLDRMIDAMSLTETIKSMYIELSPERAGQPPGNQAANDTAGAEQSIHNDGVYDVDYACLEKRGGHGGTDMRNMLPLFFLLNML